jgi:polar amino acid transport system substrate-binding protein
MSRPLRSLLLPLIGLILLTLVGCAGTSRKDQPGALGRIVDSGQLRVGMTGEQPPLNMTSRNGELFGLEVALVRVLAQSMGVEAKLVRLPFKKLLDAVEAGDVDLVMSGVTITAERSRRVSFVGPYYTSGKTILTRSEALASVQIPQDLDTPGRRFAALRGSTSEEFVKRSFPSAKLVTTVGLEEAVQKVLDGKVDALVADRETCHFAVLRHPDAGLYASEATFSVEPLGIAVSRNHPQLANLVQTYLNALAERGVLQRARDFWFRDPSWVKDLR